MRKPSNISHPLIHRTGTSQRNRAIEALQPDYAPIDGKTLADRLYVISKYAQQINYYEYIKNGEEAYQDIHNWTSFFQNSLPFQLAIFSKISIANLEKKFGVLYQELQSNPSKQGLESLLVFVHDTFITPTQTLFTKTNKENNGLANTLLAIIKSSFIEPLKKFIAIHNASATFLGVTKKNFSGFINAPWQLKVEDAFAFDSTIQSSKKGQQEALLKAGETVNTLFFQLIIGLQDIIQTAPSFIEEALNPLQESLQKKHQPHIALVFTFLELFNNLQVNVNDLGKKHLDFFYQQVLKITPKDAVPDKAHIVFEIAKHLEEYPLKKGLLLKDGKDANNEDIQFELAHEIIIDKAQITDLRSLSLPTLQNDSKSYVEGAYIAPVANSADGLGKKFKKNQTANWTSLGSKYSKLILDENAKPEAHPDARLGFVLASPVLFLQEGKRKITLFLNCNLRENSKLKEGEELTVAIIRENLLKLENQKQYLLDDATINSCAAGISKKSKDYLNTLLSKEDPYIIEDLKEFLMVKQPISCEPIFSIEEQNSICDCLQKQDSVIAEQLFNIAFSGEKDWVIPKAGNVEDLKIYLPAFQKLNTVGAIQFEITVVLEADDPMVVFYDEEKLKEKIPVATPFPLVKIELNPKSKIIENAFECSQIINPTEADNESCSLKKSEKSVQEVKISPYHFLKDLVLVDAEITVDVCGVKNLIVQNDDNLQDVNKPIVPFGSRPKVGGTYRDEDTPQEKKLFLDGGANFYIGSKEIFCKNWQKFWVNTSWKDKPLNLNEYYRFYRTQEFEDGNLGITDTSFRFLTSVLDDGEWVKDSVHTKQGANLIEDSSDTNSIFDIEYSQEYTDSTELYPLFADSIDSPEEDHLCGKSPETDKATFHHTFADEDFDTYSYENKSMTANPLEPLTVNTRKGFIKMTLAGVSFQHDLFTYVLTRQMMALADLLDPESIKAVQEDLKNSKTLQVAATLRITAVCSKIETIKTELNSSMSQINSFTTTLTTVIGELSTAVSNLNTEVGNIDGVATDLNSFSTAVDNVSTESNTISIAMNNIITVDIIAIENQLDINVLKVSDDIWVILDDIKGKYNDADSPGKLGLAIDKLADLITSIGTITDVNTTSLFGKINDVENKTSSLNNRLLNNVKIILDGIKITIDQTKGDTDGISTRISGIRTVIEGNKSSLETLKGQISDLGSSNTIQDCIESIEKLIKENENETSISNGEFIDGNENLTGYGIKAILNDLGSRINRIISTLKIEGRLGLPQEPYTPTISDLSIDYTAKATKEDMDIIHLYPFENTAKYEDIVQAPTLFPFLNDDGTLFIGIEELIPGGSLSMLFQLAEATADSEMNRAILNWHYLSDNNWIELLPDFNIISDKTDGLTVSGIVTIAVPDTINNTGNTVMPDNLYWIKVAALENAKAVAEIIGIHTQAARASSKLSATNDTLRLDKALAEGSISKLSEGDFSVKKVTQPYPSFEGRQPEGEGHFYVRVSEHLRHKGRALMLSDYEKIVLEGFPNIYKAKCISHTMGLSANNYQRDLEIAPGYILVTVIPDLTKLVSGNQLAPKVPVSLLEKIGNHLRKKTSPFAKIKIMNPRYEHVDVKVAVRLLRGKSSNFYARKLKEDITNLLAPWFLGDSEKIAFGMPVLFSDVVGFVEQLDYVDFITSLTLEGERDQKGSEIKPLTARSILTAGTICVGIDEEKCPDSDQTNNAGAQSVTVS